MRPLAFTVLATMTVLGAICLGLWRGAYGPQATLPAWGPILLIGGISAGALALELAERRAPGVRPAGPRLLREAAVWLTCLLASALLERLEIALSFGLYALLGIRLAFANALERRAAAVAVAADFVLEAALVHAGVYEYRHALAAPLPLWLPAVWGNLGLSARRLYPAFARRPDVAPSGGLPPSTGPSAESAGG